MRKQRHFGILLLILSFLVMGTVVVLRSAGPRLSSLRLAETETADLFAARTETDLRLLNGISFNGYDLFLDDGDSTFYYSLVENDSDAFDPLVDFEGNSGMVKISLLDGIITPETIEQDLPLSIVAYDDRSFRRYTIRCTTLPLMNIESEIESIHGTQKDRDLKMTLFDNRKEARQHLIKMDGLIHVRGNVSTTYFPKQGYKMTLYQKSPGDHNREADISLLGMDRQDGEWLLYAGYNDQERIRNVFSCALWNRSCAGNNEFNIQNGLEYRFLELFMNGKYWGLYALGYPLDYKQMTPRRNTESVESVYIYKKAFWKEKYSDLPSELLMRDFEIRGKDAAAEETLARSLLAEYDQWIRDGANGDASSPSGIHGDMPNAIDTWLFVLLVQGMDTVQSSGDYVNMFLTLVNTDKDKKMIYTPWDLDLTWGNERKAKTHNNTVPYDIEADDNTYNMLRNPAYFLLQRDPAPIIDRYRELRNSGWSDRQLDNLISEYEEKIFNSGAYLRDIGKWPDSTQGDPEQKLSVFRTYVHDRMEAMDRFINEELKDKKW